MANITDLANIYGDFTHRFVPQEHMKNWDAVIDSSNPPWSTTPEYHQWGAEDITQEMSKKIADVPYVGNLGAGAFELAAPFIAAGVSIPYEIASGITKYAYSQENPDEYLLPDYTQNNKWEKLPFLEGTNLAGIFNAIDMENPLSATWNRFIGAGKPVFNRMFNRNKKRNERATQQGIAKALMQKKIHQAETKQKPTYSGPITHSFDPKQDTGRRPDKPGGFTDPGKGSYGPWKADGGLIDIPLPGRSRDI